MPPLDDRSPPPRRPGLLEERLASGLFRALAPRLPARTLPDPPETLGPWERVEIPRAGGLDPLPAVLFPATGTPRGAVLLSPPWQAWGQTYFHRHGRIEALRAAGYTAMTFDLGGFRGRTARPRGFADRDLVAAIAALRSRFPDLPVHLWGVSAGGYWAHLALTDGSTEVAGAMFEDVSPHLIEWSKRMAPQGYPAFLFFQTVFRRAYRFLNLRRHAAHLAASAVAYVGGERDPGVLAEETRDLARRADARSWIVEDAGHLQAIQQGKDAVLGLALETFERAASMGASTAPER